MSTNGMNNSFEINQSNYSRRPVLSSPRKFHDSKSDRVYPWIKFLNSAMNTVTTTSKGRMIHYVFPGSNELIEVFTPSGEIIVRKWKRYSHSFSSSESFLCPRKNLPFLSNDIWSYEIGSRDDECSLSQDTIYNLNTLQESGSNPKIIRCDDLLNFKWKILNIDKNFDILSIDVSSNVILIRSIDKKFYKTLTIPDMVRNECILQCQFISYKKYDDMIVITYQKPDIIVEQQKIIHQLVFNIGLTSQHLSSSL